MKQLILKKSPQKGKYYLSNLETGSENELFGNKRKGIRMILKFLVAKVISAQNARTLFEQIVMHPKLPIFSKKMHASLDMEKLLMAQEVYLGLVHHTYELIKKNCESEYRTDLPSFEICSECKDHGYFLGKEFFSQHVSSKPEAMRLLEQMKDDNDITLSEQFELIQQVKESSLPDYDVEKACVLN